MTTATIPIVVRFREPWPTNQALVRPPESVPARVELTGPRSKIDELEEVATIDLDIGSEPGNRVVPARLSIPAGMSLLR